MKLIKSLRRIVQFTITYSIIGAWISSFIVVVHRLFTGGDIWPPLAVLFIGWFGFQILMTLNALENLSFRPNPLMRRVNQRKR